MSINNANTQTSNDFWHLTIFKDRDAREKRELKATDQEFADTLATLRAPKKERLPWIKVAAFGNKRTKSYCLRNNKNVIAIYGIEVDYDGGEMPVAEAVGKLRQAELCAIIATSPSHTAGKPRWRVYCRTSRELPPEERSKLVNRINGVLGGVLAGESWILSQAYYLGGIEGNPDHHVALIEGNRFIDEATDLDDGAIGKPGTCPNGDWNSEGTGRVDVDALLAAIRTGESYHPAELQLIGRLIYEGVPQSDAEARVRAAFEEVPEADRDDRWQKRYADIGRIVMDLYEKEARKRSEADAESQAEGDFSFNSSFRSSYKWPELGEAALHGVAGDVVRAIKPHTEGDPVAILVQYLLAVGNAMGRSAYCMVEGTKHYGNLFCVIVGKSSKARKGTAWKRVLQIVHPADADWFQCVRSGLSTGEGLIWCLRDDQDGLIDKRLLVVEEEFAKACAVMERQGNTLSVVVRDAWDGNPLEVLTKQEPAKATNTHISIVGHITENELRQRLTETSMTNGFANRFIFILAKRSNILPFGGDDLDESVLQDLINCTVNAIERGRQIEQVRFSARAREIWQSVYRELSDDKPGLYGSITARAEAQVLRLAIIYTLLDGKTGIEPIHLHAALALWEYADKSAKYIWGDLTGDEIADEILKALRSTPSGMSRTQISNLFRRNVSSARIARALSLLAEDGKAIRKSSPSGGASGRAAEVWQAT